MSAAVTIDDQIAAAKRELAARESVLRLPLPGDLTLTIEERDVWWFTFFRWTIRRHRNTAYLSRNRGGSFHIHREIIAAPDEFVVDHANGDGLDNRRGNLRLATRAQNNHNRSAQLAQKDGFMGVSYHPQSGLYRARLRYRDSEELCTYHRTPEEAAKARDEMAIEHRGEFASLNFPKIERADAELAAMRAIVETLEGLRAKERPGLF